MTTDITKTDDFGFGDIDFMPMMMIMMMAVMVQLIIPLTEQSQAQTQALQAQSFSGQEDPRTVHATNNLSWINLLYDYPFTPWASAYFINDGPSAVEIGINYPDDRFTLEPRETITVTRLGAQERISIIFFVCHPGLRSTVRVIGEY